MCFVMTRLVAKPERELSRNIEKMKLVPFKEVFTAAV